MRVARKPRLFDRGDGSRVGWEASESDYEAANCSKKAPRKDNPLKDLEGRAFSRSGQQDTRCATTGHTRKAYSLVCVHTEGP